jgi:hypothetical protein
MLVVVHLPYKVMRRTLTGQLLAKKQKSRQSAREHILDGTSLTARKTLQALLSSKFVPCSTPCAHLASCILPYVFCLLNFFTTCAHPGAGHLSCTVSSQYVPRSTCILPICMYVCVCMRMYAYVYVCMYV